MSYEKELELLADEGLLRRRRIAESPCGPEMVIDGRPLISFASNDYLGLANAPEIV